MVTEQLASIVVNSEQMRQIEAGMFAQGMPVAALMEKAASLCAMRLQSLYPLNEISRVGVLVGPGHNGGDALVIARELHLNGYNVLIYCPFSQLKELTAQQAQYCRGLGIPFVEEITHLQQQSQLIVDGLFGFGLERSLTGTVAQIVQQLNQGKSPIVSIDLPSGIHTDTGEVLGVAVKATQSFCLGLWKKAYFQEQALEYLGKAERIDFGITPSQVWQVLPNPALMQILTANLAKNFLPLPRPIITHKYKQGHLLLICGSSRYAGSAILTGLGARASGVGMLSIAVPASLKPLLVAQLPEALIIACPETSTGAIAELSLDLNHYSAIACGPGLTLDTQALIEKVLDCDCPLILDADGLNMIAQLDTLTPLVTRKAATILTPHFGEFKRLFPHIEFKRGERLTAVREAAAQSQAIILLKGARTIVTHPQGNTWLIADSTPALARGGSGDVLTGLIGGLVAQGSTPEKPLEAIVATGAWWHAQAGILAAERHSELGVDGVTLSQTLLHLNDTIRNKSV